MNTCLKRVAQLINLCRVTVQKTLTQNCGSLLAWRKSLRLTLIGEPKILTRFGKTAWASPTFRALLSTKHMIPWCISGQNEYDSQEKGYFSRKLWARFYDALWRLSFIHLMAWLKTCLHGSASTPSKLSRMPSCLRVRRRQVAIRGDEEISSFALCLKLGSLPKKVWGKSLWATQGKCRKAESRWVISQAWEWDREGLKSPEGDGHVQILDLGDSCAVL